MSNLQEQIAQSDYWYHKIELPDGTITPGWAPIAPHMYDVVEDMTGQRVLDIGAWDGYWTFEAIKRGADHVYAIDNFSDPGDAYNDGTPREAWRNFDICRDALGYQSKCIRREVDFYDMTPENSGSFDSIFAFGVMYHMRYPLLALDKMYSLLRKGGTLYIESATLDHFSPYRGGIGKGYPGKQMLMEFYPGNEYANVSSNWWVPTMECLGCMVSAAGFDKVEGWPLVEPAEEVAMCRGFIKAVK